MEGISTYQDGVPTATQVELAKGFAVEPDDTDLILIAAMSIHDSLVTGWVRRDRYAIACDRDTAVVLGASVIDVSAGR